MSETVLPKNQKSKMQLLIEVEAGEIKISGNCNYFEIVGLCNNIAKFANNQINRMASQAVADKIAAKNQQTQEPGESKLKVLDENDTTEIVT